MEEKEFELVKKFTEVIESNTKITEKFCESLDAISKKLETIYNGMYKFDSFASSTFQKTNDLSLCLDALTGMLFEMKLIDPEKYKDYVTKLYEQHQARVAQEHAEHECKCGHDHSDCNCEK